MKLLLVSLMLVVVVSALADSAGVNLQPEGVVLADLEEQDAAAPLERTKREYCPLPRELINGDSEPGTCSQKCNGLGYPKGGYCYDGVCVCAY